MAPLRLRADFTQSPSPRPACLASIHPAEHCAAVMSMLDAATGRWRMRRMSEKFFEVLVVALTAASTLLLFV